MRPILYSVKLKNVTDSMSEVEIKYSIEEQPEGIELMGVDAGLDWIPGDSILLNFDSEVNDLYFYSITLKIVSSCEFRARAFVGEDDLWEDGTNHTIERDPSGKIDLLTDDLILDSIELVTRIPVKLDISPAIAKLHVENIVDSGIEFFQILVEIAIWIEDLLINPINNLKVHKLPDIIRYLKVLNREYDSKKVNDLGRSIYLALTNINILITTFSEEDDRVLTGSIEKAGYIELFKNLPQRVKELDTSNFGDKEDSFALFQEHMKYI